MAQILSADDAMRVIRELQRMIMADNTASVPDYVNTLVEAGQIVVEPVVSMLMAEEGTTKNCADIEFTKSRNRGFPYSVTPSFSFSPKSVRFFTVLSEVLLRIGKPAADELISVVWGRWISVPVGMVAMKMRFSPRNHEGIMIAMEILLPLIRADLESILVEGHDFSQEAAVYALRFASDAAAVKRLLEVAATSKFLDVRFVCTRSLAHIARDHFLLVAENLKSPSEDIRRALIKALVYADHPDTLKTFVEHFPVETYDPSKANILEYFCRKADPCTIRLLEPVAASDNSLLSSYARDALEKIARKSSP